MSMGRYPSSSMISSQARRILAIWLSSRSVAAARWSRPTRGKRP